MTVLWLAAALILAIIEVLSVDLLFIMLAIGALGAGTAGMLGASLSIQVAVFAALSSALLFIVRPWAKRLLHASQPHVTTNAQGLIGQEAVVLEELTGTTGRIRLAGEVWSARTEEPATVPVDARVRVTRIDGATAVVVSTSI